MVKKIISLILVFSMVNVYAASLPVNLEKLDTIIDDYDYAVNVEWAGSGKSTENKKEVDSFRMNAVQTAWNQIDALRKQGLTDAELTEAIARKMPNAKVAKEFIASLEVVKSSKMTRAEANKFMMANLKSVGEATGANWAGDGDVVFWVAMGLLLAVIVVAAVAGGSSSSSSYCYDEYVCYDYYDSWGWYLYTDCFYETYCY